MNVSILHLELRNRPRKAGKWAIFGLQFPTQTFQRVGSIGKSNLDASLCTSPARRL